MEIGLGLNSGPIEKDPSLSTHKPMKIEVDMGTASFVMF